MSDEGIIFWGLLMDALLGLLLARQVLKLRYWVIKGLKDQDEKKAYSRIENEYCEQFLPSAIPVGPSQDERIRSAYRGFLFAAFAPWYLLHRWGMGSSGHHGFSFFLFVIGATASAASVQQFWTYFRWQDTPGWVESVEFKSDHLVVLTSFGERNVYVFDGTMQVLVALQQDVVGVWPLRFHHRTEVILSIKDASGISTFPFRGPGCGAFLALCRHAGAKVDVLAETDIQKQFADFTARVDSCLVAPPAMPRPHRRGTIKDMVCNGCGAKSSFDSNATSRVCEYCGSADLTTL